MDRNRKILFPYYLISIILIISGCNLFSTREPESPDTNRTNFSPPTSADIVISNLKNSILNKNTDNYLACLADSSMGTGFVYIFLPSAEALARYGSIYNNWNLFSERQTFNSLFTSMETDIFPSFILQNNRYDIVQPDSVVFIAEYKMEAKHNVETIAKQFTGSMQLTIKHGPNGLWYINRWIDTKIANDSIESTWSIMKAQFYNK
jgi:hypothetical protein